MLDADSFTTVGKISGLKQSTGSPWSRSLAADSSPTEANDRGGHFRSEDIEDNRRGAKPAGGPDGILYDPASKHIFTFNGHSNDATAIDPANGTVVGTVALGGGPETGVADGKGMIYDNIETQMRW